MPIGRAVARAAGTELVAIVRELESRRNLEQLLAQQVAAQQTISELEAITEEVGRVELPHKARLKALSRLAKAITACAAEHSFVAMRKIEQIKALSTVRRFCDDVESDDMFTLGSGLSIFANIALQGYTHLCVDAGVCTLLTRLLCPPSAATDPSVVSFAANALNNLTADTAAAAAFTPDERSKLLSALPKLLKVAALAGSHLAVGEALSRLDAVHRLSEREREKVKRAAQKKMSSAVKWEKHLEMLASEDTNRSAAASRMARRWRDRNDTKRVEKALQFPEAAKALVAWASAALAEDAVAMAERKTNAAASATATGTDEADEEGKESMRLSERVLDAWHAQGGYAGAAAEPAQEVAAGSLAGLVAASASASASAAASAVAAETSTGEQPHVAPEAIEGVHTDGAVPVEADSDTDILSGKVIADSLRAIAGARARRQAERIRMTEETAAAAAALMEAADEALDADANAAAEDAPDGDGGAGGGREEGGRFRRPSKDLQDSKRGSRRPSRDLGASPKGWRAGRSKLLAVAGLKSAEEKAAEAAEKAAEAAEKAAAEAAEAAEKAAAEAAAQAEAAKAAEVAAKEAKERAVREAEEREAQEAAERAAEEAAAREREVRIAAEREAKAKALAEREQAAVQVQAAARRREARREADERREAIAAAATAAEEARAATTVQSAMRGKMAKKEVATVRAAKVAVEEDSAATALQTHARAKLARKELRAKCEERDKTRAAQEELAAATTVQAHARSKTAREAVKTLRLAKRLKEEAAAKAARAAAKAAARAEKAAAAKAARDAERERQRAEAQAKADAEAKATAERAAKFEQVRLAKEREEQEAKASKHAEVAARIEAAKKAKEEKKAEERAQLEKAKAVVEATKAKRRQEEEEKRQKKLARERAKAAKAEAAALARAKQGSEESSAVGAWREVGDEQWEHAGAMLMPGAEPLLETSDAPTGAAAVSSELPSKLLGPSSTFPTLTSSKSIKQLKAGSGGSVPGARRGTLLPAVTGGRSKGAGAVLLSEQLPSLDALSSYAAASVRLPTDPASEGESSTPIAPARWAELCATREAALGRMVRAARSIASAAAANSTSLPALPGQLDTRERSMLEAARRAHLSRPPRRLQLEMAAALGALRISTLELVEALVEWQRERAFASQETAGEVVLLNGRELTAEDRQRAERRASTEQDAAAQPELPLSRGALRAAFGKAATLPPKPPQPSAALLQPIAASFAAPAPAAAASSRLEAQRRAIKEEAEAQCRQIMEEAGNHSRFWDYGVDYVLRMLTDVRRLPLPTYTDPFALEWSFEQDMEAEKSEAMAAAATQPARMPPAMQLASPFEAQVTNSEDEVTRMRHATRQLRALIRGSPTLSACAGLFSQFEQAVAASASGHADADPRAAVTHLPHRWKPAHGRKRPPGGAQKPSKEWRLIARALYPSHESLSFAQQLILGRPGRRRVSQDATNLLIALRPPPPPEGAAGSGEAKRGRVEWGAGRD